jgi:PadR family transcriptional regulator, regulatory protein AphA
VWALPAIFTLTMARTNKTKYSILGALSFSQMSGYDIKHWVLDVTGRFWAESDGQIYPALALLLKDGMIKCDETLATGKRPRKVYSITAKGRKALEKWLVLPAQETTARNEFLLKLFLGKNMPAEDYLGHIKRQQKQVAEKLEFYRNLQKHIQEEHQDMAEYWLVTIKNAIYHAETELKWCDEIIMIND